VEETAVKGKILVAASGFGEGDDGPIRLLRSAGLELVMNPYGRRMTPEELIAKARGCIGTIAGLERYERRVIDALPGLRCISRIGSGVDTIDEPYAREKGIVVCSTPLAPVRAVAELTVGMILDLFRGISLHDRGIRRGTWERQPGRLLQGSTVGIVGLGRIGREVAGMLVSLQVTVWGTDIKPDPAWVKASGIRFASLFELLGASDVVTIHVPFLKSNRSLIGKEELALMKKGAYLLNLSRGGIVDEEALRDALLSGRLAGAALDTFEEEPYSGPLREFEQVILTPHIGSHTRETRHRMEEEAARNLLNALEGGGCA
jgi:D-3-phosphoglycerate dehydrogenase